MFPLEKFYVEMCNWAHNAIEAENLLGQLSDEQVANLACLVAREISDGSTPIILALVKAMIDGELRLRSSLCHQSGFKQRTDASIGEVSF